MDYELGGKPLNPQAALAPVLSTADVSLAHSAPPAIDIPTAPAPPLVDTPMAPTTRKPPIVSKRLRAVLAKPRASIKKPRAAIKKVWAILRRRSIASQKPRHSTDLYLKSSGVWGEVHLVKAWHAKGHQVRPPVYFTGSMLT